MRRRGRLRRSGLPRFARSRRADTCWTREEPGAARRRRGRHLYGDARVGGNSRHRPRDVRGRFCGDRARRQPSQHLRLGALLGGPGLLGQCTPRLPLPPPSSMTNVRSCRRRQSRSSSPTRARDPPRRRGVPEDRRRPDAHRRRGRGDGDGADPDPEILWRKPPVLALAALPGRRSAASASRRPRRRRRGPRRVPPYGCCTTRRCRRGPAGASTRRQRASTEAVAPGERRPPRRAGHAQPPVAEAALRPGHGVHARRPAGRPRVRRR